MIMRKLAHAILFSLSHDTITTITSPSSSFSSFSHRHFPPLPPAPPPPRQNRKELPPAIPATNGSHHIDPIIHRSLPERSHNSSPEPLPDCPSRRDIQRVCSLLCLYQDPDFDHLFDGYISEFDSDMVLSVLRSYRRLGRKTTSGFFSWVGFKLGFRFDDRVIEFMADFLGRRKLFDDLKCLLKTVSSHKGSVSSRTVAISVRFLGRQGRIGEALSLFEEMEAQFGFVPDNMVFNNVLYVLCKKTPVDESSSLARIGRCNLIQTGYFTGTSVTFGMCIRPSFLTISWSDWLAFLETHKSMLLLFMVRVLLYDNQVKSNFSSDVSNPHLILLPSSGEHLQEANCSQVFVPLLCSSHESFL